MYCLVFFIGLLAVTLNLPPYTECSNHELLLSLNKNLLRSLDAQLPNPSIHLALRLSNHHNLAKEKEYLTFLINHLTTDSQSQSEVGYLALYTLALKSSCHDLNTVTFSVGDTTERLLTRLKKQMIQEKEHIASANRPSTNYYQYALGLLALCVTGIRVDHHVSHKLIGAVEHQHITHGEVDTLAMAAMALQCLKDSGSHALRETELHASLNTIKQKLLAAKRPDGHIGNEYSTGLAVQALFAMGTRATDCATSLEAMRTDARNNKYDNPMALSQVLPALQHKSYLAVKKIVCLVEDDSLVLEPTEPTVVLPSQIEVYISLEVVTFSGTSTVYELSVPLDSSLLEALEILRGQNTSFTFDVEPSLWGPFLSMVNGEQARQSDRRYWHLSSDGTSLTEGIKDFKIAGPQKITIKNTSY